MPKPIDAKKLRQMEADAREIGGLIGDAINAKGHKGCKGCGFALVLFSYNGAECTYISSAEREDMIKLFEELLAHWKIGHMNDFPDGVDSGN